MIDANEFTGEEQRGIKHIMFENNMVDVYAEKHDTQEFATHINGSKRIDYILSTAHTTEFISKIGYTPFYEHFSSDHRGIICDIDVKIFGTNIAEITDPPIRLIGTNTTEKEAINYIENLHLQFRQHRIFEKSKELYNMSGRELFDREKISNEVNKLDELITNLMLRCEQTTCSRKSATMWSPAILHSHIMIKYWNMAIKQAKGNINLTSQLKKTKDKLCRGILRRQSIGP